MRILLPRGGRQGYMYAYGICRKNHITMQYWYEAMESNMQYAKSRSDATLVGKILVGHPIFLNAFRHETHAP
jgi:hypothetical protein